MARDACNVQDKSPHSKLLGMTRHIAFLRAINVAGHASIKMTDLTRVFMSAGCKNVRTVIQSGNVLFEAADRDTSAMIRRVELKLLGLLGSEIIILFRTIGEVESLVRAAPFKDWEPGPDVKFYVAFLCQKPRRKLTLPLVSSKEALEAFKVKDREVFIVSRRKTNGVFGFPNNFIETEFGFPATTRNWSTIKKIVELPSGSGQTALD